MAKQPEMPPGDRATAATVAARPIITEEASVTMSNIRRGLGAMLIATMLLGLFNSEGLTIYARDLPGNAFSDAVVALADDWHDLMLDLGLTRVTEVVREAFLSFKETEW